MIQKVQSSLNQNMSSVEKLLIHQRKDIENLNLNLESQVVKEEEFHSQLKDMNDNIITNAEIIKKDVDKIANGLSEAATQQENGECVCVYHI